MLRRLPDGVNKKKLFQSIVFLFVVLFMFLPMINRGLWRPDEPRVAGICAEMARTGNYVVPRLNGKHFLEHPPLYYTAGAALGTILGADSDIPYRLCSLLFGLMTLGIVFGLMYTRQGTTGGLLASGILASSWGFFRVSHWVIVDIALVCGVTLAMYAYIRLITEQRARHAILFGLGLGLSFMVKGLVGPAIITAAVLTDLLRQRDITLLRRSRPLLILACALLPILPWVIALYQHGGWPFLREVVVVNNLMRFTGAPEGAALGHQHGPLFYWDGMFQQMIPWTLLLIPAALLSLRRYREDPFLSWIIGPLLLLSLSATKRGVYLAPLCPAAACMITNWLMVSSRRPWEQWMLRITWGIAILGSLAPFAGIALGRPVFGLIMGGIALSALVCFSSYGRIGVPKEIRLVLIICIAMSACTSVYFSCKKPTEDFLAFAHEAVAIAQGRTITLIGNDESNRGLFSLAAGRTLPVIAGPSKLKDPGLYVWTDKEARILSALRTLGKPDILAQGAADGRELYLVSFRPNTRGSRD